MAFCGNCGAETAEDGVCPICGPAAEQAAPAQPEPQQAASQQPPPASGGAPAGQLKTDRTWLKFFLLSFVTFGIYAIVFYYGISSDINTTASRYDGKKTMNYALLFFLINPVTLYIGTLVWSHRLFGRIGDELKRRGINDVQLSSTDYWIWGVLGTLFIVGPLIAVHKLAQASNAINANYNVNG